MHITNSIAILSFLLFMACGRNFEEGDKKKDPPRNSENERRVSDSVRNFALTQSVECEDEIFCNTAVAKVIVLDRGDIKYCTGVLVKEDILLTSSSCLAKSLRFPKVSCTNSIISVFPGDTFRKQETVFCDEVISASNIRDDLDPALRSSDYAFIKLKNKVTRKPVTVSKLGIDRNASYTIWKADYETNRVGVIRSKVCIPFYDSYANPFSSRKTSPLVTMRDCGFEEGSLGAPIINLKGEVVGVVAGSLDKSVEGYASSFLIEELADIMHVSNLHCSYLPWENISPDFDLECSKDTSVLSLDRKRSSILTNVEIHRRNFNNIQSELEVYEKYFIYDIIFRRMKNGFDFELDMGRPKCFQNIRDWIGEFTRWRGRVRTYAEISTTLPRYELKTKLNRILKPISEINDLGEKEFTVEFNPASSLFETNTYVTITRDVLGRTIRSEFENITDTCEAIE